MFTAANYIKAESLQQAFELNQKRTTTLLGGGCWLRLGHRRVGTLVDLSGLGLDSIEETSNEFSLGAMVTLRQLETNQALKNAFGDYFYQLTRSIVGVQFRNCATLGGSLASRFGFSDLLTGLLALDCEVELVGAGRISLEAYAQMPYDRDVLAHVYIKKTGRRAVYQSARITATDLPQLTCAVSVLNGRVKAAVGARPARAALVPGSLSLPAGEAELEAFLQAAQGLPFGGNMRAGEEYRRHLAGVLLRRAIGQL